MANIKAQVAQVTPALVGEADFGYPKMTKTGALYTADWNSLKSQIVLSGQAWNFHIGTLTGGGDVGLIVGGGNGTTVDSDQPEMIIGVDAGYYLIPFEINVMCDIDCDADGEYGEIVIFADRSQAPPTSASGTPGVVTGNNLLDGGPAFPGRCYGGVTTDLTDPVMTEFITGKYFSTADNGTAASALGQDMNLYYVPSYPRILAGPCEVVVCFGGTAAVNGMISATFGCVPATYFPVS